MELLFLGTSSGVPTRSRNVSGLAVLAGQGKRWYLVDCGEGTQHRLLRTQLSLHGLAGVFITHVHGDHCYGLPGLLATAGMQGRTQPLDLICPEGIEAWLTQTLRLTQTWLPYALRFHATESLLQGGTWRDAAVSVSASLLAHRVPSYAYRVDSAPAQARLDTARLQADRIERGPVWGALLRQPTVDYQGRTLRSADYLLHGLPGHSLVVAGDNSEPQRLTEACRGARLLVHEATYTAAVAAAKTEHGHSSAAAVAEFAEAVAVPNLVLTHFSPRYHASGPAGLTLEDLRQEAAARYSGTLILAADYDRYRIDSSSGMVVAVPRAITS